MGCHDEAPSPSARDRRIPGLVEAGSFAPDGEAGSSAVSGAAASVLADLNAAISSVRDRDLLVVVEDETPFGSPHGDMMWAGWRSGVGALAVGIASIIFPRRAIEAADDDTTPWNRLRLASSRGF